MNATVFTHPKHTKANLTSDLHKRANKYLTWYFNGSSFVIYNSFQRDEVSLPHNLLGFNYTVKKKHHHHPPHLPGTYECVTGCCAHTYSLSVTRHYSHFSKTGGELNFRNSGQKSILRGAGIF